MRGEYFAAARKALVGNEDIEIIPDRLGEFRLRVEDRVAGFRRSAVLRWRLAPGAWRLEGNGVSNGSYSLRVSATVPLVRMAIVSGWESRYYSQKTPLPVLEIEVAAPGEIHSEFHCCT